jgi:hypothetical protein
MSDTKADFNLDSFLTDLGLPADKLGAVKDAFGDDKVQQKLKESVLRQSDYDKKFNAMKADLAKQQEDLQAEAEEKQAAIVAEKAALGKWKTDAEKQLAGERIKRLQAEERLLKGAELYGVDLDSIPVSEMKELAKKAEADEDDDEPKKGRKKAVVEADVFKAVEAGFAVQAEIASIVEDWKELNPGKKFPHKEFLTAATKNAAKGITVNQTAEQMFEFTTTRDTRRMADIEAKAEAKWKAKYEADLTQELSKRGIEAPRTDEKPRSTFWQGREGKTTERSADDRVRLTREKLAERAKA